MIFLFILPLHGFIKQCWVWKVRRNDIKFICITRCLRVGMLVSAYFSELPTELSGRDESAYWTMRHINFFLTFSGAAEGSVWNMVMKAPGPHMAIGLTGPLGLLAPEPVEEGCLTESACARIPSKHVPTSLLTNEQFLCYEFSQQCG